MYHQERKGPPVAEIFMTLFLLASRPYVQTLHVFLRRGPGLGYFWSMGILSIPALVLFNYFMCTSLLAYGDERLIRNAWPVLLFTAAILVLGIRHQLRAYRNGGSTLDRSSGDALAIWYYLPFLPVRFSQFVFEPIALLGIEWAVQFLYRPLALHLFIATIMLFITNCINRVIVFHSRRQQAFIEHDLRAHNPGSGQQRGNHGVVRQSGSR